MLSEADLNTIEAAIKRAEEKTTAEISCIVAKSVSTYPEVPLLWAVLAVLLLAPAILWGLHPALLLDVGWSASPTLGPHAISALISRYTLFQIGLFLLVAFAVSIPGVRIALTPRLWKRHRVHQAAYAQYLATGLHQSQSRTGVVIFACIEDRCVSVVADELIHKIVGTDVWDRAVAAVQDGMRANTPSDGLVKAIDMCGAALIEHFPGKSPNLLSDRLLEL